MSEQVIYQVALPVPLRRLFDYLAPNTPILARGTRVIVPFGKRQLTGIIMGQNTASVLPLAQLKTIERICGSEPLFPEQWCNFVEKLAQYYHHPIGEVAFTGMPLALKQGKPVEDPHVTCTRHTPAHLTLNETQQAALDAILAHQGQFQPFLLEGVTGSGKTEVYLQAVAQIIKQNQQALILIPEISLTPQTTARFQERFGEVICYHSRLTNAQRLQAWLKVRYGKGQIVIGTRSALFLPFTQLGLIVIDEEHDPSFKQQEGFRYCGRDASVLRAKMANCPIVLGSATPAFETLYNTQKGKYLGLYLPTRIHTSLPEIHLLDVRHKKLEGGLSAPLLQEIETHCQQGQVLLFINRRGFAPTFMCYSCGWIAACKRCDSRLTFHQQSSTLVCHHCLHTRALITQCPECSDKDLHPVGQGTERIESVLQHRFPQFPMVRIDSDVTRKKGELEHLLQAAERREVPILIGTQILAKGHHFPHLSLVAIVDADGGLFSVDFRAVERMAQLIIQVAGRAGRVHNAGKVFIQTFHPDHPMLQHILQQNYRQLAQVLLTEREKCHLPPYSHFALLRAQAAHANLPETLLRNIQQTLQNQRVPGVNILGPVPAPMLKRQGYYRYQLLLQANERKPLHQTLSHTITLLEQSKLSKRVRWSLDVDPIEMF